MSVKIRKLVSLRHILIGGFFNEVLVESGALMKIEKHYEHGPFMLPLRCYLM